MAHINLFDLDFLDVVPKDILRELCVIFFQFAFFILVTVELDGDYEAMVAPYPYRFEEEAKRQISRELNAPPIALYGFGVHPGTACLTCTITIRGPGE